MVVHVYNPSTHMAEAGGLLKVQRQPGLHKASSRPFVLHSKALSQEKNKAFKSEFSHENKLDKSGKNVFTHVTVNIKTGRIPMNT